VRVYVALRNQHGRLLQAELQSHQGGAISVAFQLLECLVEWQPLPFADHWARLQLTRGLGGGASLPCEWPLHDPEVAEQFFLGLGQLGQVNGPLQASLRQDASMDRFFELFTRCYWTDHRSERPFFARFVPQQQELEATVEHLKHKNADSVFEAEHVDPVGPRKTKGFGGLPSSSSRSIGQVASPLVTDGATMAT